MVAEVNWNGACDINSVVEAEEFLASNIKRIFDKHAPIVTKRVTKKKAPWRTQEIVRITKEKDKLKKQFLSSQNSTTWKEYKRVRNSLNRAIRLEKKNYFENKLASCGDSRVFWRCLRQNGIVGSKGQDQQLPSNLEANEINKYFAEMGTFCEPDKELEQLYDRSKRVGVTAEFKFRKVSNEEVISAMNEISSRAVGTDDIGIDMIRAVSPYAIDAITHLVNMSLTRDEFPHTWKTSIVKPLPKIQTPTSVSHLRPISILPAMSKIVEKLVVRQMTTFVEEQNILPKLQSGFRKHHGTCTALVNLFNDLFEARDGGLCSSLVMLDYSQAFDSISHSLLLAKMKFLGFGDHALNWFRSYLVGRCQVTRLGTETSSPLMKARGVPQGSCLGPVLFTLYTSDLDDCVRHCTVHLYADDCQLHMPFGLNGLEEAIAGVNSDLESIRMWSDKHGLKLNANKCTVIYIAAPAQLQCIKDRNVQVKIGDESLSVGDTVKTLGVVLDSGLSFSDHVTYVSQRALGKLRGMYMLRSILPESVKLRLVTSLVLSVFYYCFPAYGNSISREDLERIQKMQNTAIRFVYSLCRRDHVSPFRDAAGLMTMDVVCRMQTCCLINRVLNQQEPQYLAERLCSRGEISQRSTRQDDQLHFNKVRLEIGRRGFSHFGPKLYNELPCNLKLLKGRHFQAKLRKHFLLN